MCLTRNVGQSVKSIIYLSSVLRLTFSLAVTVVVNDYILKNKSLQQSKEKSNIICGFYFSSFQKVKVKLYSMAPWRTRLCLLLFRRNYNTDCEGVAFSVDNRIAWPAKSFVYSNCRKHTLFARKLWAFHSFPVGMEKRPQPSRHHCTEYWTVELFVQHAAGEMLSFPSLTLE